MIIICVHHIRSHCIDTKRNMSHWIVLPNRDDLDQSLRRQTARFPKFTSDVLILSVGQFKCFLSNQICVVIRKFVSLLKKCTPPSQTHVNLFFFVLKLFKLKALPISTAISCVLVMFQGNINWSIQHSIIPIVTTVNKFTRNGSCSGVYSAQHTCFLFDFVFAF